MGEGAEEEGDEEGAYGGFLLSSAAYRLPRELASLELMVVLRWGEGGRRHRHRGKGKCDRGGGGGGGRQHKTHTHKCTARTPTA